MEDLMSVVKLFLQLFGTNDAIPTTLDSSLLNQLEAFFQNEGTRELASSFKELLCCFESLEKERSGLFDELVLEYGLAIDSQQIENRIVHSPLLLVRQAMGLAELIEPEPNDPTAKVVGHRYNFSTEVHRILSSWLASHSSNPYPNTDEAEILADKTGLSLAQVKDWFINARRRKLHLGQNESNQITVSISDEEFDSEEETTSESSMDEELPTRSQSKSTSFPHPSNFPTQVGRLQPLPQVLPCYLFQSESFPPPVTIQKKRPQEKTPPRVCKKAKLSVPSPICPKPVQTTQPIQKFQIHQTVGRQIQLKKLIPAEILDVDFLTTQPYVVSLTPEDFLVKDTAAPRILALSLSSFSQPCQEPFRIEEFSNTEHLDGDILESVSNVSDFQRSTVPNIKIEPQNSPVSSRRESPVCDPREDSELTQIWEWEMPADFAHDPMSIS